MKIFLIWYGSAVRKKSGSGVGSNPKLCQHIFMVWYLTKSSEHSHILRPPSYWAGTRSVPPSRAGVSAPSYFSALEYIYELKSRLCSIVADPDPNPDPDPPDPRVFGPLESGSGSISKRYGSGSGSGSFYH
jgi:hypothetical protein